MSGVGGEHQPFEGEALVEPHWLSQYTNYIFVLTVTLFSVRLCSMERENVVGMRDGE